MSSDITTTGRNVAPSRVPERRRLTNAVVILLSIGNSGEEMLLARELADIERCRGRPDIIRETIEKGDVVLAAHRSVINDLCAALVPVTQKDIGVEIADLMLAFPGKDDLAEFIVYRRSDAPEKPRKLMDAWSQDFGKHYTAA